MTTSSERQSTPLSLSGKTPEPEPVAKKSKNRKLAKKSIPHSSTLHGLWGKSKSTDEQSEASIDDARAEMSGPHGNDEGTSKLAAALESARPSHRMITPPRSLPDVIPESPVHPKQDTPKSSRSGGKKRTHQQSPSEGVRRSPRNHRLSKEPSIEKPVAKPHPFFLGKAARMILAEFF